MCPNSKLLLINRVSGEVKYIGINYFDFLKDIKIYMAMKGFDYCKYESVPVDCGKCAYCKKKKINYWKFKLNCEARTCQNICHLTLTFSDEYLNSDYSLVQRCFKRVRKMIPDKKFKYFLVSEHGTQSTCRLHYHILIFGLSAVDTLKLFKKQWYYGFIKVKPFENRQIGYLVNYIFKQDEIRRQSQRIGYKFWEMFKRKGIIRLNNFSYNFPYYYRKKFNSVEDLLNKYQVNKIKAEIEKRYKKVKDKGIEILSNFLRKEAEQKNLNAVKFFEKLGYRV